VAIDIQSVFDFVGGHRPGTLFAEDGFYELFVDQNGDLRPEVIVKFTFQPGPNGQKFKMEGLTTAPVTGDVTPLGSPLPFIAKTVENIQVFCGPRDDPFFFDLVAFKDFEGPNGDYTVPGSPYLPTAGLRPLGTAAPQ